MGWNRSGLREKATDETGGAGRIFERSQAPQLSVAVKNPKDQQEQRIHGSVCRSCLGGAKQRRPIALGSRG